MAGVDEMLTELEGSVGDLERFVRGEPQLRGWLAAHRKRIASLRMALSASSRDSEILPALTVGESDALLDVLSIVSRIAPTDAPVLIGGETGTGKELIARKIHQLSRRSSGPFIAMSCGELAAADGAHGLLLDPFEAAEGGTLFLDEVGELSAAAQTKLLCVLADGTFQRVGATETRRVNVRIVAATNRDLSKEVTAGRFRQDLLYRLDVIRLGMPALRERDGDVRLLAIHLLDEIAREHGQDSKRFTAEAMSSIEMHVWPGNVRELANVVERAVILSTDSEITPNLLGLAATRDTVKPPEETPDMKSALRAYKRSLVERALETSAGDNNAAARLLGVHPKYLYQLIRELELPTPAAGPVSVGNKKTVTPAPGVARKC